MSHFNYIDLIIVIVLIYFGSEAFRHGFWVLLADFISFLVSLLLSFRFYKYAALFLRNYISLSLSLANALGFLILAIAVESTLGVFLGFLIGKLPPKYWKHKFNKILGLIPALGEGLLLISFFLTLGLAFPIKSAIKNDIEKSFVGSYLLGKTRVIEKSISEVFGGVIENSLTFLSIKPGNRETIPLQIDSVNLSVDSKSEIEMIVLVNEQRQQLGIKELIPSLEITEVARAYARDMWNRKYFSHISPEGVDVGGRLTKAKIQYSFAGENLALAPTVKAAFEGLINSEGHRENILDKRFNFVGIGVIDNGVYGKMFVQIFTD